jgi:hypothetical protein
MSDGPRAVHLRTLADPNQELHMSSKKWRLATVALSVLGTAALAAPAAQAKGKPYVEHLRNYPAHYTDDTLCSFPVQVDGSDDVTIRTYSDRTVYVDKFRGTVTGPTGKVLNKSEDAVITDFNDTGYETWTGVEEAYKGDKGPFIAKDEGPVTFDQDGNIVSEKGQHPLLDGPGKDAVCAALA